jgi:membrane-bound serine protease (ClpP class)
LLNCTPQKLLSFPNFGEKTLEEVYKALETIGLSRGGLYCMNWAAARPEQTLAVYLDNAVCDFKSWPGGKPKNLGTGKGSDKEWANVLKAYDFKDDAEAIATAKTETEALKAKLIDVISPKLDDLLQSIDGRVVTTAAGKVKIETKGATVNRSEMNLREKILRIVTDPTIAYLFLLLGLAGLYFEFSTPGAILPGVLGGICLILALYAFQQLPINYAGVLLILLAIVMFIAEIKVISHGILTLGGIAALIMGSMMLIDSPVPGMRIPLTAILLTTGATAGFFLFVVGAGIKALQRKTTTGSEGIIGEVGVVRSRLAPRGQVFLCGELWNAESEEPVEAGDSVRVTKVEGLTLKVVPVQHVVAAPDPLAPGR